MEIVSCTTIHDNFVWLHGQSRKCFHKWQMQTRLNLVNKALLACSLTKSSIPMMSIPKSSLHVFAEEFWRLETYTRYRSCWLELQLNCRTLGLCAMGDRKKRSSVISPVDENWPLTIALCSCSNERRELSISVICTMPTSPPKQTQFELSNPPIGTARPVLLSKFRTFRATLATVSSTGGAWSQRHCEVGLAESHFDLNDAKSQNLKRNMPSAAWWAPPVMALLPSYRYLKRGSWWSFLHEA